MSPYCVRHGAKHWIQKNDQSLKHTEYRKRENNGKQMINKIIQENSSDF